jgi:uncharacterized integral membrane protein
MLPLKTDFFPFLSSPSLATQASSALFRRRPVSSVVPLPAENFESFRLFRSLSLCLFAVRLSFPVGGLAFKVHVRLPPLALLPSPSPSLTFLFFLVFLLLVPPWTSLPPFPFSGGLPAFFLSSSSSSFVSHSSLCSAMPPLERRYDQSSASSDEEDYVHSQVTTPPVAISRTSSSGTARPSSRAASNTSGGSRRAKVHESSSSESTDSEEEARLREELEEADAVGVVRGATKEKKGWNMQSVSKGSRVRFFHFPPLSLFFISHVSFLYFPFLRLTSTLLPQSSSATQQQAYAAVGANDDGADAAERGVSRSGSHRSSRSEGSHKKHRSSRRATGAAGMYEVGKAPSSSSKKSKNSASAVPGAPGGGNPGAQSGAGKSRKRIWLYVLGGIILIILLAVIAFVGTHSSPFPFFAKETDLSLPLQSSRPLGPPPLTSLTLPTLPPPMSFRLRRSRRLRRSPSRPTLSLPPPQLRQPRPTMSVPSQPGLLLRPTTTVSITPHPRL